MCDAGVDVSDLNIVMTDLEKPLELAGDAEIATFGVESTSGVTDNGGVKWSETSSLMSAEISIPGLMGQPAEVRRAGPQKLTRLANVLGCAV